MASLGQDGASLGKAPLVHLYGGRTSYTRPSAVPPFFKLSTFPISLISFKIGAARPP